MAQVKKYGHEYEADGYTLKYEMVDVKVGDGVCFKSDHEQCGKIVKIETGRGWDGRYNVRLHLHNDNGFGGDYLRYATDTVVDADDCWL